VRSALRRRLSGVPGGEWGVRLRRLTRPALLGTLRRTSPLSDHWGYDRGTPVDRYYIEAFLAERRDDIRGRVLEVKDSAYTERFGHSVVRRAVLDIDPANPAATIIADLAATALPPAQFDCFLLTQTLQYIYEPSAAIAEAHRLLAPGGALLATLPALGRLDRSNMATDYWRFTPAACARLFGEVFGADRITIRAYGNALATIAFVTGMAAQELSKRQLQVRDERFPLLIAVRAAKS
jgi:SAM-dependent methyltransferase